MSNQKRLVFDIETIGEDFDQLDETSKATLTRWIEREAEDEEDYARRLKDIKEQLGFSPLTGEIVAIGVLDIDKEKGGVYFQAPGQKIERFEEGGIAFEPMTEADILKKFWEVAKTYNLFGSFNGRGFDVPFMMVRSAVHGIKPSKNLMAGRYLSQQRSDAVHIDLMDQLSFLGAVRRKETLHMWSRAFGIKSPKGEGVTGDDVAPMFKAKKYLEIARYNIRDLRATRELFKKWEEFFNI